MIDILGPQALHEAHKQWGWYLALGILSIALGIGALLYGTAATLASVIVLGALLVVLGIVKLLSIFQTRNAGHIVLYLLVGVLDLIVGWMLMQHALAGAAVVTLLLAALLVFQGFYGFVAALWLQFPHYGWFAFSAIVSLLLGVALWLSWPISAAWFIGFAVGINLLFAGLTWATVALKLRSA
jgi:uncharacterized membrane protein HdeD (DUF308 family)